MLHSFVWVLQFIWDYVLKDIKYASLLTLLLKLSLWCYHWNAFVFAGHVPMTRVTLICPLLTFCNYWALLFWHSFVVFRFAFCCFFERVSLWCGGVYVSSCPFSVLIVLVIITILISALVLPSSSSCPLSSSFARPIPQFDAWIRMEIGNTILMTGGTHTGHTFHCS